jgi:N-acyl-D-amino-acid deacylase
MHRRDFLYSATSLALAPSTLLASEPILPTQSSFSMVDEAMVDFLQKQDIPGGAISILLHGKLVYAKGYGWADMERQQAFLPITSARIGSISKPITALAVLKLVSKSKLGLDEPAFAKTGLEPFLRNGEQVDARLGKTTVRHLLQHTTGYDEKMSGNFTVDVRTVARAMGKSLPVPEDIVRYYMGRPRTEEPGSRYAYDNAGYLSLGRLIAKVSGQPYETYVRENILSPLGISKMRVGARLRKDIPAWEATPYGTTGPQQTTPGEHWESCGGWAASAVDLAKIVRAVTTNRISRLLPAHLISEITRRPDYVPRNENNYYGLGWDLHFDVSGKRMIFGHSGSGGVGMGFISSRWDGAAACMVFNRDKSGSLQFIWDGVGKALDTLGVTRYPQGDLFSQYPDEAK